MAERAWVTTIEMAQLACIAPRRALKAVKRAASGKPWRSVQLLIREVRGCRSRGGLQYEVAVSSLPADLRLKWEQQNQHALATKVHSLVSNADDTLWQQRLALIRPVIEAHEQGQSVTHALEQIAATGVKSFTALRGYFRQYLEHGAGGLLRKRRADAGASRVLISGQWDAATKALPDEKRGEIVAAIELKIRSLYAAGAPGWRHVAALAQPHLAKLTRTAGVELTDETARTVCRLPRHFVRRRQDHKIIAIKYHDAKQFSDRFTPRIRRDRSHLRPMEWVAGDVHHFDILYRREDGSTATPKLIAWLDLATNRVTGSIVFLEKGAGVRQEDVIESYIDVTQHPAWGMSARLYLDNGGEYQTWTEFAANAMRCAQFTGRDCKVDPPVKRARAYNAQAKVIESQFSAFERGPIAMIPGYIGGQRMAAKTKNVGHAPEPFDGSPDDLVRAIAVAIEYYNRLPQRNRLLKDQSPVEAFNAKVAAGWRRTEIERHLLEVVFADDLAPMVRAGGAFTIKGREYRADALAPLVGQAVHVRVPKVGDKNRIAILSRDQRVLAIAEPVTIFEFGDKAGAREQRRQVIALNGQLAQLRDQTEPVDLVAEMRQAVGFMPGEVSAPADGRIRLAGGLHAEAKARKALPASKVTELSNRSIKQQRRVAMMRELAALERK